MNGHNYIWKYTEVWGVAILSNSHRLCLINVNILICQHAGYGRFSDFIAFFFGNFSYITYYYNTCFKWYNFITFTICVSSRSVEMKSKPI